MMKTNVFVTEGQDKIWCNVYAPKDYESKINGAVVISHGYNGSADDWDLEGEYFAGHGILAFAIDFCGASAKSRSTGTQTDMTISSECSNLQAVLKYVSSLPYVDSENVFLFGGSQGGFVSALVAERELDSVKKLFLYYPALCIPDNWLEKYPDIDEVPDVIDFWDSKLGKGFVVDLQNYLSKDKWGKYSNEIYVFHGSEDEIVPVNYSRDYVAHFNKASLTVIPKEKHGYTDETRMELADRITELILE